MEHPELTADVAIIGAGPCGVTLANYLGLQGIDTLLLDRSPEILDYPRGVGMDDETLRSFQGIGVAGQILEDLKIDVPLRFFTARGRMFAEFRPATREFGWPRRATFMQPHIEGKLRRNLARFPSVRVLLGHEMTTLEQDPDGVRLGVRDPAGRTLAVRARFVYGADGGRSDVRRAAGIRLLGDTSPVRWVVIDVKNDPLDADYSALYCQPTRPHVCIPLPHGYRRWEFMLFPHENEEEMVRPESIRRLIAPHVGDAALDIVRIRPYAHHSRLAESFGRGRVFLGGDAAHLMPPWAGQGMNSGIRDATNIAWKFAAVVRGRADRRILESYDAERRHHAAQMINLSDTIGAIFSPTNRALAFLRDVFFLAVGRIPSIKNYVLQMRFKPMPRYVRGLVLHEPGKISKTSPVGRMFIQPQVEDRAGVRQLLDDMLGPGFALLVAGAAPALAVDNPTRRFWDDLGTRAIRVHPRGSNLPAVSQEGMFDLIDSEGLIASWMTQRGAEVVVLRPDRYVAAVGRLDQFEDITARYARLFTAAPD